MKSVRVVIAGGGTGGHLYPGVAIAKVLQSNPRVQSVQFIGTKKGLEARVLPQCGFSLHTVSVIGFVKTKSIQRIKSLFLMSIAFLQSLWLLWKIKPNIVLGVGGYASGPFVLASAFFVKHTYIWEPNAAPGLTNRVLSLFVKGTFLVFDKGKASLWGKKVIPSGIPIRSEMEYKSREFSKKMRVFAFGGSQGASAINCVLFELIKKHPEILNHFEFVHQTGKREFAEIEKKYQGLDGVTPLPFIENIWEKMQWADIVICRSGASTIAEIIACRKAAIMIPLPTAADNHQLHNAKVLSDVGAGEIILQKDLSEGTLLERLMSYKEYPEVIKKMEDKLISFEKSDAAQSMAKFLVESV